MSLDARNYVAHKTRPPKATAFKRGQRVRLNQGSQSAGEVLEVSPLGRYLVRFDSKDEIEVERRFLEPETPEVEPIIEPQVKVQRSVVRREKREPAPRFVKTLRPIQVKPTPELYCQQCGAKMERKQFPSGLEAVADFLRRKYCNVDCQHAAFRKSRVTADTIEQWKRLREQGWSLSEIAAQYNGAVSVSSVFRLTKAAKAVAVGV